jgi:hypothetical protein
MDTNGDKAGSRCDAVIIERVFFLSGRVAIGQRKF